MCQTVIKQYEQKDGGKSTVPNHLHISSGNCKKKLQAFQEVCFLSCTDDAHAVTSQLFSSGSGKDYGLAQGLKGFSHINQRCRLGKVREC